MGQNLSRSPPLFVGQHAEQIPNDVQSGGVHTPF